MVCMLFDMYNDIIKMSKRGGKVDSKQIQNYDLIPKLETIQKRDLNSDKNFAALLDEMKEFCSDFHK